MAENLKTSWFVLMIKAQCILERIIKHPGDTFLETEKFPPTGISSPKTDPIFYRSFLKVLLNQCRQSSMSQA